MTGKSIVAALAAIIISASGAPAAKADAISDFYKGKKVTLIISSSVGGIGLPIREEVLARNGDDVITRNSYGARCLNEPDVLFFRDAKGCGSGHEFALILLPAVVVHRRVRRRGRRAA